MTQEENTVIYTKYFVYNVSFGTLRALKQELGMACFVLLFGEFLSSRICWYYTRVYMITVPPGRVGTWNWRSERLFTWHRASFPSFPSVYPFCQTEILWCVFWKFCHPKNSSNEYA